MLEDTDGVVVIDAGPGTALLEFLAQEGIDRVDIVLISHADRDHIEGLIALIASEKFEIGVVRVNSDALKASKLWDDLLYTLNKAHLAEHLDLNTALTIADSGTFDQGDVHIEIVAPNMYMAGKGPGSKDRSGRRLTTNSISAVIRLVNTGGPIAIFTGDLDNVGLDNLIEDQLDCTAPILIFPHHGGKAGSADMAVFTRNLVALTQPQTVIFSIRRGGKYNNPQPDIVTAVRESIPNVRVGCTQLSGRCAAALPTAAPGHLTAKFAQGRQANGCCGGTFVIEIDQSGHTILPATQEHQAFISAHAETALCQAPLTVSTNMTPPRNTPDT